MVGLDAIEREIVTEVPADLHAAWSPIDQKVSARRSRRLLLDMAFVRSVDALDVYIRYAFRKPTIIQSPELRRAIDMAGNSIFKKFEALNAHHNGIDPIPASLVALMITWRNRAAHAEADIDTDEKYLGEIRINGDAISKRFRGLDSSLLIEGYDTERAPYFKEVTSFINATTHYVEDIERQLFKCLDHEMFLKELVWKAISPARSDNDDRDAHRKKRLQSVWGRDLSDRRKYVESFLEHEGLSRKQTAKKKREAPFVLFDEEIISRLVKMTPSEVFVWAEPPKASTKGESFSC
jgi:hypothetical protein